MARTWEELERDSRELVSILKRTKKINLKIFERLYPDKTHFIYELLQNAEDAGAGTVKFGLYEDKLVFEHDGKRLFTLKDVESITGIGYSSKNNREMNDDDDQNYNPIGKFCVGFQAVFAYTNSPEIHSGEFHFRIEDLMVPVKHGGKQKSLGPRTTRFLFPFDNPDKTPDDAVAEIEERLQHLQDNTLLFLDHIYRIEYTLPNGESGSLERSEYDNDHVEIHFEYSDKEKHSTHWLRFRKMVSVMDENGEVVTDEDGKPKKLPIAVAYNLQQREHIKKKEKTIWEIASLEPGQVFIYFPAEKETSNLRFHLHAPFASPADRSSVVDCADNEQLRDELAKLVAESLLKIRDYGLLDMEFLAVLPNPTDNLPSFYEPIREAIVTAFQNEKLTPTKSGSYAPTAALYRGPASISDVIKDNDLSLLTGYKTPLWVANPSQLNKREDHFLDSLEIDEWGWKELSDIFHNIDEEKKENIEKWIKGKNDLELMRLYALLGFAHDAHHKEIIVYDIHIVRVLNKTGVTHVLPEQAFFPPENNIPSDEINFVKIEVYTQGRSDFLKKSSQSFLEYIGVRLFDQKVIIERKLESYNFSQKEIDDWHFSDIKQFIRYWKDTGDINIFKYCNYHFILGISQDGNTYWCKCDALCVDDPYFHTGLGSNKLQYIHGMYVISPKYKEKLSETQLKNFIEFIEELGITKWLEIKKVGCYGNPNKNNLIYYSGNWSLYGINEDYSILNIDLYINACSLDASLLIWNTLIHADEKVKLAKYQRNAQRQLRTSESQLIYHLRTNAWIPDRTGYFRKPVDMTREELPDEFIYDDRNGLLTAIEFGKRAKERDADYQRRNSNAKEFGFASVEEAELLSELKRIVEEGGQSFDSFLREVKSKKKSAAFPERPVSDQERREARFAEQFADAADKTSETRQRTVRTSRSAIDPTTWLQRNYTNADDQMFCQICQKEMPFKKRDGAPYFESREIFAGKKGKKYLSKEHEAQYLALCPVCAAKYKEFVQNDEQAMATLKAAFLATDGLEIPVTLGEEQTTIRFVESHLLDFRKILKTEQ